MGILGMWTADLQDNNIPGTSFGSNVTVSSATARTGTYSFRTTNNWVDLFLNKASDTVYFRYAFWKTPTLSNTNIYMISEDRLPIEYASSHSALVIYDNKITVLFGDSGSTDVFVTVPVGTWNLIEFYTYSHASAGEVAVKFNGNTIYDATGLDTQYSSYSTSIDKVRWFIPGAYIYMDDMMARDDQWCGAGGLYVLVPNSGSATEDWVASSGNPEDCVDEIPVSYDDYVSTEAVTADTEHLFNVESLPIAADSIGGVGVFVNSQSDYTVDANVRSVLKSGGTQEVGSGILLSTSPSWQVSYWDQNPDDAADWETADIDALEIGVETN